MTGDRPRLLGHWGTCPGITFVYSGLNGLVRRTGQRTLLVTGPGHGAPAVHANLWLEGTHGAALDDPGLLVACIVGDGEAETGPTAGAWQGHKFLEPATSGTVLPVLHLNVPDLSGARATRVPRPGRCPKPMRTTPSASFATPPDTPSAWSGTDEHEETPMSERKLDPDTAASELEDADFAGEHARPTYSDEPGPDDPDESVPSGEGGMDIPEHDTDRS